MGLRILEVFDEHFGVTSETERYDFCILEKFVERLVGFVYFEVVGFVFIFMHLLVCNRYKKLLAYITIVIYVRFEA